MHFKKSPGNNIEDFSIIADYFIALSNETGNLISNLKLQKLVYYAQAWHLAIAKSPLFSSDFEAWVHGPVLPGLYVQYSSVGWKPIHKEFEAGFLEALKKSWPEDTIKVMNDVTDEYFGMTAFQLEQLTHSEEPWLNARKGLTEDQPSHNTIEKDVIARYYAQFVK